MRETIEVRREPLVQLIDAAKRYIRRHGGDVNGNQELSAALEGVVRDLASAELRGELEKPLPVASAEELDGG